MKGHIFNLLEEFLIEIVGMGGYEAILSQCTFNTDSGFISTVNYPDEQLNELVDNAVSHIGISVEEAHFSFGKWILPHLTKLVPAKMIDLEHPARFLETVDYIHRVELKKLYPDAEPPNFSYEIIDEKTGALNYQSRRAMFNLVEGVLQGVAEYFKTEMSVERKPRADLGEGACDFIIHYSE